MPNSKNSIGSPGVAPDSALNYRRIRVPRNHGETLHVPSDSKWREVWDRNLLPRFDDAEFQSASLSKLRSTARSEIIDAAVDYTKQYCEVNLEGRSKDHIVMSGHQPELFHPGVWYKNFVLSDLGRLFQCTAINLVVDNDNCKPPLIGMPVWEASIGQHVFRRIYYDDALPALPYENRPISNLERFVAFGKRTSSQLKGLVAEPIIDHLWPYVLENSQFGNLGESLAKGRHRLEQDHNVATLELPLSHVTQLNSFAVFVNEILTRHREVFSIYNETIESYRQIHKIKNTAQPLPPLRLVDGWYETPFWIWTPDSPQRRSLFAKANGPGIDVSDLGKIAFDFETIGNVDKLHHMINDGLSIRPKALMTTLFHRLISCDLFIHGIGGSKYDQLTDEIALRLFRVVLPKYLTISGTFKIAKKDLFDATELSALKNLIRDLKYHPEAHIADDNEDAQIWIEQKRDWIAKQLPRGHRFPRHDGIQRANLQLQQFVAEKKEILKKKMNDAKQRWFDSQTIDSRELSFCVHDSSLIDYLKKITEFNL